MRKRRAESSSIQESPLPLHPPQKKKRSGVCDAGRELEPALFTTVYREGCRKRPGCCEDHEQRCKIVAPGGKLSNVTDDVKKETENERVSRKFRGACDACTREMTSEESTRSNVDKRTKVTLHDENKDELCAFNSFQFWRTPLPALDLSLLDTPSTTVLNKDISLKDTSEEMET
ncbi:hypothetical protein Q7C36_010660 [Tachysurus vachellii]|uniref:WW-binding domain-containing protein n=2 Tax=Tachysurus vachellii TaxID=175792 RepID=A0AA88SNY5_TACVA|nr:hypothetical protein Q7C36_010660 [Tachysurus vachellii]